MYFPFPLYVILLAVGWRIWRKRGALDRKDALAYYLLLVAAGWLVFPSDLLLTNQFGSAYGVGLVIATSSLAVIAGAVGILLYALWPETKTEAELEVKVYREIPVIRVEGSQLPIRIPSETRPKFKQVFFQVRNIGKSTAPNCRAILRLPSEHRAIPSDPLLVPIETEDYLEDNLELDWFRTIPMGHPEEKVNLGKAVDIPPHPGEFLLAGTICIDRIGPPLFTKSDTYVHIDVTRYAGLRGNVNFHRALRELQDPRDLSERPPLDICFFLDLSWEREHLKTQTFQYRLQVKSIDEFDLTAIR